MKTRILSILIAFLLIVAFTGCPQPKPKQPAGGTADVQGVYLNSSSLEIEQGTTYTLAATVTPNDAKNKNVTWLSSDTTVVSVNNGVLTAVAESKTDANGDVIPVTITAKTAEGNFIAECSVIVYAELDIVGLAAPLWYDATVPTRVPVDGNGNTNVGWKDYNNTWDGSAIGSLGTEKTKKGGKGKTKNAGTITKEVYDAEYATRDQILNRSFNKTTGVYEADAAEKTWDLTALKAEFGIRD
jgi:hypothetical protein